MKISSFYGLTVKNLTLFFLLLVCFAFVSCNQDPIFYNISNEVAPIPPRIEGLTTDIVVKDDNLYVSTMGKRNIHQYKKDDGWDTAPPPNPGGTIRGLAATSSHLYALTFDGIDPSGSKLKKYASGESWVDVVSTPYMQKVYAAGDRVFVWAGSNPGAGTLYYEEGGDLKSFPNSIGMLNGAVEGSDIYFLACSDGIYTVGSSLDNLKKVIDGTILGIIKVGNRIVAAGRNSLYYNDSLSSTNFTPVSNFTCTGAMEVWEDKDDKPALLLLGAKGSSTEYGYREIILTTEGELDTTKLSAHQPGQGTLSTTNNYGQYHSSIGTHPIVSIRHFSGILFAGTNKNGLWSYRERNGDLQWNAEN
ncbi:MAG: hypothetical protein LBP76_00235 [Treponema sp.]|jgi:hypothetical protein|nr:hypothetical protein [Treponema sp.]